MTATTTNGVRAGGGTSPPPASPTDDAASVAERRPQPLAIRAAHWLSVPVLVLMAGSGLQIFSAYPSFGARGAEYGWYPFAGTPPPEWLRFGGWLAGARQWHFALAWVFGVNGTLYVLYLLTSGEWRRRAFLPVRDAVNAMQMMAYYLRLRSTPPPIGLSFSSVTMRWASFGPTPWARATMALSSRATAAASSAGGSTSSTASAAFGPTP